MSKSLYIILIYTFLAGISLDLSGQQYEINPVSFNSNLKSEFSPMEPDWYISQTREVILLQGIWTTKRDYIIFTISPGKARIAGISPEYYHPH